MQHLRSNYRARHRRTDRVGPAPWRSAGGRAPTGSGFNRRTIMALVGLALIALATMLPWYLGHAGADTLEAVGGSSAGQGGDGRIDVALPAPAESYAAASRARRHHPSPTATTPDAAPSPTGTPNPAASASTSASASPAPSLTPAKPGPTTESTDVVELVNTARAEVGCPAVHADARLAAAALAHSEDMVAQDYFSHTSPEGLSPWDRAADAGYPTPTGENIAVGQRGAVAVMDAWMDSEGHRDNILNCDSVAMGVGLAYDPQGTPYWTQMFGAA